MKKELVEELRQEFLDGATPSLLMSMIVSQHKSDPRLHFIIKDYFAEAFGIQLLRNVVADEDYHPEAKHAHFNRDVVPEIVEHVAAWHEGSLDESWLASLTVHSLEEHVKRLQSYCPAELERVWETLTEKERYGILRKVAQRNRDWEIMKALALLAERLQQKIVEVEGSRPPSQVLTENVEKS